MFLDEFCYNIIQFVKIARESKSDNENNNANIWKPHLKNIAFFRISPYIIWELVRSKQFGYSITIMPFRFVYHILKTLTKNNKALEVFLDEFRCNM